MCVHPLVGLNLGINPDTGKSIIKIKKVPIDYDLTSFMNLYPKDMAFLIPCGHCVECTSLYRKQWSTRCACEALYHDWTCFLTLTYDDEHYSKLNKHHLRKFFHDLRADGLKIRYFACGERGSQTGRNHYHCLLFGYRPDDMKFYSKSSSGERMYHSKYLQDKWNKGLVIVQEFSPKTASYVAGYVGKKLGDSSGFIMMSTHPGLGFQFYEENKDLIYQYDQIYLGVHGVRKVPRYFIKLLEKDGFVLDDFKNARKYGAKEALYRKANVHGFDFLDKTFRYDEIIAINKFNKLRRQGV